MSILRGLGGIDFGMLASFVAVAGSYAVEGESLAAASRRFRFRSEIKSNVLPRVAALRLQTETGGRLIPTVHHAILATRIARHPVNYAVFFPFHFLEQFGVARVMGVRH